MDTPNTPKTVADIKARLQVADAAEFAVLQRSLLADTRKGVRAAVEVAQRRLQAEAAEHERLLSLYSYQAQQAGGRLVVGLDEVGRGPVAGPLTVGAVVLPENGIIAGLNDSKQVAPEKREKMAAEIKQVALAWAIEHIDADQIDAAGMSACLRVAFRRAVAAIEAQGVTPAVVLLDGNPLHLDAREINVIKGDSLCASIAAASIIAKVERDNLMCQWAKTYPAYCFEQNKGYASADHIEAIKRHGLTPLHRTTFCTAFTQEPLF
ncbi:MAG: ribonuclease HII [Raoultibacter sp.]